MKPQRLSILLILLVSHFCDSGTTNEVKKFPAPRHILTDPDLVSDSVGSGHPLDDPLDDPSNGSGLIAKPLVSFVAGVDVDVGRQEGGDDENRTDGLQLDTTTSFPENLGLQSNPNLCSRPARCEPLPPNATW